MRGLLMSLAVVSGLTACGSAEPTWAPDTAVAAARYEHPGPKALTLFTVVNNRSGSGAHSGLLINGSQRLMFDPAGSWALPALAERNDVHFGMTDKMIAFYIDYHARETYRVVEQTVEVSPAVAEQVLQKAMAYGAVPKAQCTTSISNILKDVPGFETLPTTMFPNALMEGFATLPGVKTRTITDDDTDDNHGVLLVQTEGNAPATEAEVAQAKAARLAKGVGAKAADTPDDVTEK